MIWSVVVVADGAAIKINTSATKSRFGIGGMNLLPGNVIVVGITIFTGHGGSRYIGMRRCGRH